MVAWPQRVWTLAFPRPETALGYKDEDENDMREDERTYIGNPTCGSYSVTHTFTIAGSQYSLSASTV